MPLRFAARSSPSSRYVTRPLVVLEASSTASDGAFFAYLEDDAPDEDANITARIDVADQIAPGLHERLVVNATGEYERANVEMIGERCNPFQRGRVRDRG